MRSDPFTAREISRSVIAVPPLARRKDFSIDHEENRKLIRYITRRGIRTLLYGGNANFYHMGICEYPGILEFLAETVPEDAFLIPSVGPAFGTMMAQTETLGAFRFPTVMVLPAAPPSSPAGISTGIRILSDKLSVPVILYIKQEGYLPARLVGDLVRDGVVCAIKYAVVRADPAQDLYLQKILDTVDSTLVISGIGEQPAIIHMRDFGLGGFTSGCVCMAPGRSLQMLKAIQAREFGRAEEIRRRFAPLENLRNSYGPVAVLHQAVSLAGIAETGFLTPLLENLDQKHWKEVEQAAQELRDFEERGTSPLI